MGATAGTRVLKRGRIAFEERSYDLKVKGAEYAAEALDWPLPAMVKTLVVFLGDKGAAGRFVLCCMPGDQELSLKKLARHAKAKSARMSTPEEAEKQTGYLVGGIGPFGVRKPMETWFHDSIPELERMGINGGRRGLIVFLDPKDAQNLLKAQVADLATDQTGG
jgi:Cys-tRNA(Pro)/Cys-tRNA(Cys) deacylase